METKKKLEILRINRDGGQRERDMVVKEYPFTLFINDKEIITLLCSPDSLEELIVGFLYSEGFFSSLSHIEEIRIDREKGLAHIYLKEDDFGDKLRGKRTITSGCGKGSLFYNVLDSFKSKKIANPLKIQAKQIASLVKEFNKKSELFLSTGGVHSCALCSLHDIILFKEDIGRHNALDKVLGRALMEGIDTRDKIILTSGRISSEILIKSAKRQIPVLVSRSAPTSLSVDLAESLGITLVGFARGPKMNIYTNYSTIDY